MRKVGLVVGYGGATRWIDNSWQTRAETISCARLIENRLVRTAEVELALAHVAEKDGALVGRNEDKIVGYRLEGLTRAPETERVVLAPTHFVSPEKVWRAGPNAVIEQARE